MRHDAGRAGNRTKDRAEIRNAVRNSDVTDALARQRKRLAVRIADDCVIIIFRNIRHREPVKCNLAIRFIRNDENRVAIFLLFFLKDRSELLNGLLGVNRTARIVRRVDDDRFRVRRKQLFKRGEVNLPVLRARRHDDQLAANRFDEATVLWEERCERDEFIVRLAERLEGNRDGGSRAGRHENVLSFIIHVKPAVEALCHGITHLRRTGRDRVAVNGVRLPSRKNIDSSILDERRRRHIRIPEAEIKHGVLANLSRTFAAEFENRPDRRFFRAKFVHLCGYHRCHLSFL